MSVVELYVATRHVFLSPLAIVQQKRARLTNLKDARAVA